MMEICGAMGVAGWIQGWFNGELQEPPISHPALMVLYNIGGKQISVVHYQEYVIRVGVGVFRHVDGFVCDDDYHTVALVVVELVHLVKLLVVIVSV